MLQTISWQHLAFNGIDPYFTKHASGVLPEKTAMSVAVIKLDVRKSGSIIRSNAFKTICIKVRLQQSSFWHTLYGSIEETSRWSVRIQIDDIETFLFGHWCVH